MRHGPGSYATRLARDTSEPMQQSQSQGQSQFHDRSDLPGTPSVLAGYDPGGHFCELLHSGDSQPVIERLAGLDIAALKARAARAEAELYNLGITFTVYSEEEPDRPHPALRRDPAHPLPLPNGTGSSAASCSA